MKFVVGYVYILSAKEFRFYTCVAMLVRYLPSSCVRLSARPSIWLSVSLSHSHADIVPKQRNLGSRKQHHTIA